MWLVISTSRLSSLGSLEAEIPGTKGCHRPSSDITDFPGTSFTGIHRLGGGGGGILASPQRGRGSGLRGYYTNLASAESSQNHY